MKRLMAAGYRVAPQWRVGTFRIDLVVEGECRRLAVECDGDRYQALEKLPEDLDRQAVLERMGWSFARVRGSEFFRDPERALKSVLEKLQRLEIFPMKAKTASAGKFEASALPIDRVIRRAEELRNDWAGREAGQATRRGLSRSVEQTAAP
jgi:very-short-patch-repair endonuclease